MRLRERVRQELSFFLRQPRGTRTGDPEILPFSGRTSLTGSVPSGSVRGDSLHSYSQTNPTCRDPTDWKRK